jgi:hypothetical protein
MDDRTAEENRRWALARKRGHTAETMGEYHADGMCASWCPICWAAETARLRAAELRAARIAVEELR